MKRKGVCLLICTLLAAVFILSCAYSHIQRPLDTNFEETTLGSKIGRSHSQCILWLFAWGDSGTLAAAKNGGITTVKHADTELLFVLFGLYTRVTTVVYGD
jgi:hypothetical protein